MKKAFIRAIIDKNLRHYHIKKSNFLDMINPDIFDIILNNIENTCGTLTKKDYAIIIAYLEK